MWPDDSECSILVCRKQWKSANFLRHPELLCLAWVFSFAFIYQTCRTLQHRSEHMSVPNAAILCTAFVAQLGERQTEDLKVAGSKPAEGILLFYSGCGVEGASFLVFTTAGRRMISLLQKR